MFKTIGNFLKVINDLFYQFCTGEDPADDKGDDNSASRSLSSHLLVGFVVYAIVLTIFY